MQPRPTAFPVSENTKSRATRDIRGIRTSVNSDGGPNQERARGIQERPAGTLLLAMTPTVLRRISFRLS